MKLFRYPLGHEAGQTVTVKELIVKLKEYPEDMPVMAEWEGVVAYIKPENFSFSLVDKGLSEDKCWCLVIDVERY